MSQRIGPLSIREEIFADLAGTVIEIKPVGEVSMSAEVRTDSVVSGITMRMDANTNHNDLKIKGVTLRVPGIMMPVIADGLDIALTGRGVDTVTLTLPGPYEIDTAKDNTRINILRGSITVSDGEGVMHKVSISVPAACNW